MRCGLIALLVGALAEDRYGVQPLTGSPFASIARCHHPESETARALHCDSALARATDHGRAGVARATGNATKGCSGPSGWRARSGRGHRTGNHHPYGVGAQAPQEEEEDVNQLSPSLRVSRGRVVLTYSFTVRTTSTTVFPSPNSARPVLPRRPAARRGYAVTAMRRRAQAGTVCHRLPCVQSTLLEF